MTAFGCVIRDSVGSLLEAASFGFAHAAADPMYVEAGAILWGLWGLGRGWADVIDS